MVPLGAALLGGLIVLLMTGRRERAGTERVFITPDGAIRTAMRPAAPSALPDSVVVPWTHVQLLRVSPFWHRLRMGPVDEFGEIQQVALDFGFRCPQTRAVEVQEAIAACRAHAVPDVPPGVT